MGKRTQALIKRLEQYKIDDETDQIDDDIDVKKHFLTVHFQEVDQILSKDIRLAVLDEQQKQFIRDMVDRAYECRQIFHEKSPAAMKYAQISLSIIAGAIINTEINKPDNPSFHIIQPREQDKPVADIDEKILEKLEGKKK